MTPAERAEISAAIVAALKNDNNLLTDDERRWVRLAIEKEAQSIRLRQAIIEKTTASLVWAAIVGLGLLLWNFIQHPPRS